MSKTLNYLLIFGAGLTAGVLSARGYFKSKYQSWAEDEIESVRQAFYRQMNVSDDISQPDNQKKVVVNDKIMKAEPKKEAVNYQTYYEKSDISDVKANLEVEMAEKEFPRENDEPYLISEEDYSETEISFDKLSCTFYIPDRLIVDDLSREVVEPDVIGEENIKYLIKTDEKFVYIRNELLGCDMEISRDETSVVETGDVIWRE